MLFTIPTTRRTLTSMWQCSQQHDNKEEAKFCSKCGEKRITRVYCSECGSLLEPEDLFCTSCGHRRDTEPKLTSARDAASISPVVPPQVEQPVVPPAQTAPRAASSEGPSPEQPAAFRFGGRLIEMKDDGTNPEPAPVRASTSGGNTLASARSGGMSSMKSGILGFVVSAAVLGLAFYLITR